MSIFDLLQELIAPAGLLAGLAGMLTAIWVHRVQVADKNKMNMLLEEHKRKIAREDVVASFRNPLMIAAYDLQSRLYNIIKKDFFSYYFLNGDEYTKQYVLFNTSFVISQYFGWIELIRKNIQFIDIEGNEETKKLTTLLDTVVDSWQTDAYGQAFRIFSGNQRAIGEMMVETDSTKQAGVIGYQQFIDKMSESDNPLFRKLMADIANLGDPVSNKKSIERLSAAQQALIDLLIFLDPLFERFPESKRQKV